jgi:hypothetical protein
LKKKDEQIAESIKSSHLLQKSLRQQIGKKDCEIVDLKKLLAMVGFKTIFFRENRKTDYFKKLKEKSRAKTIARISKKKTGASAYAIGNKHTQTN